MQKKLWSLHIQVISIILIIALVVTGFFSMFSINNLQGNGRVINYTGTVRGATQRLVKKELNHIPDDALIVRIDQVIEALLYGEEEEDIIRLDGEEFQALLLQMKLSWTEIKAEVVEFRNGGKPDKLYELSEDYFELADKTVLAAENYSEKQVQSTKRLILGMNVVFLLLACLSWMYVSFQQKRQEKLLVAENENMKKKEQLNQMFRDIVASMNEISELMYVSDLETHELLFANEAGRKMFHLEDKPGQKCYKVLQGLDEPCPYCTTPLLKPDENYSWEFTNPLLNRHYLLKDRLIQWEGKPARVEIAFDMTDAENEKIELKNLLDGEKVIVECVRELYQNPDISTAIKHVLKHIGEFLSVDRVYVITFDDKTFTNTYEWCKEGVVSEQRNLQGIPINTYEQWYSFFIEQDCVMIDDMEKVAQELSQMYEELKKQGIERLVSVPLEFNGERNSCIGVDNPPKERIANAMNILETLRYFLMLASHRARDEAQLEKLSYYDTLTTFFNRNRYIQDIEQLSKKDTTIGVVFVDVNGLKEMNDRYGHDMGDSILKECARNIRRAFYNNTHYRIGGDEFVVFCEGTERKEFYNQVNQLKLSFEEKQEISCHAAIGAQWAEESGNIEAIIKIADEKMYADKREFYRNRQTSKRYRHHNDYILHLADFDTLQKELSQEKFFVLIQPKLSIDNMTVIGAEALVRYRLREDVIVMPNEFIPILEESRTISQVDFYVFEWVCAQIQQWEEQGVARMPMSVNFSRYTMLEPNLIEKLSAICNKYGVSKSYLEIEITESVGDVNIYHVQLLMSQLRQVGFTVAIDDFGVDSSKFSLFSSGNFDVLKIDKSLILNIVDNDKAQAIIQAVVNLCNTMKIKLIAEGVEEEEQVSILKDCGIQFIQGFLFSHPLSAIEFEKKYL